MDTKSDEEELVNMNISKDDSTSASLQPHDDSLSVTDDLTERFSQQQMTLTKLRQMVLDEEQTRSKKLAENKLKLEKYTSQLARIRDRTHNKIRSSSSVASSSKDLSDAETSMVSSKPEEIPLDLTQSDINVSSSSISDVSLNLSPDAKVSKPKIPNREATKILHQQIIQHKAAIAERAKNEKELEIALIKMQKQLEENQHQSAEIIQLGQTKPKYNINIHAKVNPVEEGLDSNKTVSELRNRTLQLENNILDLQETCKEKDSVIKSKTEAITLMSADLSKKGKDTLDLLDDTKLQMQQMQENFANMEINMKLEKQSLIDELEVSKNKITYLEEANYILEGERFKLSVENNNMEERLSAKEIEINRLNSELLESVSKIEELISNQRQMEIKMNDRDEKGSVEVAEMENFTKKIEDLEKVNALLKETNKQLESKIREHEEEPKKIEDLEKLNEVLRETNTQLEFKINEHEEKGSVEVAVMESMTKNIEDLEKVNALLKDTNTQLTSEIHEREEKGSVEVAKMESFTIKIEDLEKINAVLIETNTQLESRISEREEKGVIEVAEMENLTKKIEDLEKLNAVLKDTNAQLQEHNEQKINERKELELSKIKENKNVSELQDSNEIFKVLDNVANSLNARIINLEMSIMQKETELNKLQIDDKMVERESSENIEESIDIDELKNKIKLLEELNSSLKKSNIDLQEKLAKASKDKPKSPEKSGSPKVEPKSQKSVQRGKGAQKNKNQQQKPVEQEKQNEHNNFLSSIRNITHVLYILNNEIIEKECCLEKKDLEIKNLIPQEVIQKEVQDMRNINEDSKKEIISPFIDSGVEIKISTTEGTELDIISLRVQLDDALKKIEELTKEISDGNKSMIKLKATHKTKVKQMQKSIDDYSKVSDSNSEVVRLQSEVNVLTQRITELEDDKGNLQLHLVDYDSDRVSDSQLNAKLIDVERIAEERLKAIADLEQQKFELVQELHLLRQQLVSLEDRVADLSILENEHVSCEIKHAQMEEQLDLIKAEKKKSLENIELLYSEKQELSLSIELFNKEKSELNSKLEFYMNENMELIDRLEKLSAEKVSSAESIEMVESLTTQEKMEIEQYQKGQYGMSNIHEDDMKDEATEHQDTMEKIENLQIINSTLSLKLDELMHEKKIIEDQFITLVSEKDVISLEAKNNEEKLKITSEKLEQLINENELLNGKLEQLIKNKPIEETVVKESITPQETVEEVKSTKSDSKGDKKFTKEILRLKSALKHKEAEIAELNSKLTDMIDATQQVDLTDELDKMKKEHLDVTSSLQFTIQGLENDKKIIQEELININNYVEGLKREIAETNSIFTNNCDVVLAGLKCHISTLQHVIEGNETEITELKLDVNQYQTYSDKINYLIFELQEKIKIIHLILINNKKEIEDIENEKEINRKIMAELEAQSSLKNKQINELDVKLKDTLEVSQKNDLTMKKLKELCKRLKVNENKLEEKIANLESEKQSYCSSIAEIETLEDKLKNISSEKSTDLQKIQDSEALIESLKKELTGLQSKYDNAVLRLNEISDKLTSFETESPKLHNELSELHFERDNIASELECCQKSNTAFQFEIALIRDEVLQIKSEKSAISSDLDLCKSENAALQMQVNTSDENLKECYSQIDKLRDENASYITTIENKTQENENIKQGISKTDVLEEQLNSKENEIKSLIEKLENIQSSYNEFKSMQTVKINEHDAFVESLEDELEKYKEKNAHLEERVSNAEALESQVADLQMQVKNMEDAYYRAVNEKVREKEKSIQMQSTLIGQKNILDSISIEHAQSTHMVNYLNDTISKLNDDLQANKYKNDSLNVSLLKMQDLETEKVALFEESGKLKMMVQELDEKLKQKLKECEELEVMLQNQSENFEVQIKEFNDQHRKIQDELNLKCNQVHDIEEEFKLLKVECEGLHAEKQEAANFYSADSNLQGQIDSLCATLKEKDVEIERYQAHVLQLQMSRFDNNSQQSVKGKAPNGAQEQARRIEELEDVIRNYDHCIQEERFKVFKMLSEKDTLINKLKNDAQSLKLQIENTAVKDNVVVQKCSQYFTSQPTSNPENVDFIKSIEDQIISSDSLINDSIDDQNLKMIRAFQHDPPMPVKESDLPLTSSTVPIVEEEIKPKVSFLCFDDNAEEVALKICELQSDIKRLTDEKEKIAEELQQSQIKTKKALIKLKEFKMLNDRLKAEQPKQQSADVDILDSAIQEELSSQVKVLEEKIKEINAAFNKEKLEKDGLIKRVDVITSANERLINVKEKQDIELQMSMSKILNLEKKMEKLQWDSDFGVDENWESKSDKNVSDVDGVSNLKNIEELNKKINSLQDDNEELQTIIDQQSSTVKELTEKQKDLLSELLMIKDENEVLNKTVADNLNELQSTNSELKIANKNVLELDIIRCENDDLKEKYDTVLQEFRNFSLKQSDIIAERDNWKAKHDQVQGMIDDLIHDHDEFTQLRDSFRHRMSKADRAVMNADAFIRRLQEDMYQLKKEKDDAKKELNEKISELLLYKVKLVESSDRCESLQIEMNESKQKFGNLESDYMRQVLELMNQLQEKSHTLDNNNIGLRLEEETRKFNEATDDKNEAIRQRDECKQLYEKQLVDLENAYEQQMLELTQQLKEKSHVMDNKGMELRLKEAMMKLKGVVYEKNKVIKEKDECQTLHKKQLAELENAYKQQILALTNQLNEKSDDLVNKEIMALNESKLKEAIKERDECKQFYEKTMAVESERLQQIVNECENLKNIVTHKEDAILELTENYNKIKQESDFIKKIIQAKDEELQKYYDLEAMYSNKFNEYNSVLQAKDAEIQIKFEEFNVMNERINSTNVELLGRIEEVQYLKQRLGEYDQLVKKMSEMEEKFSDLSHEKDAELANMRLRFNAERTAFEATISESSAKVSFLENQLEIKIEECRSLNSKVEEMRTLVDEEAAQMSEMRSALEAQEIEIVMLKENLAEQIKAYEKMHRAYMRSERHVSFSEDTKPGDDSQPIGLVVEKPDSAERSPPRADLDLAMYMLHQRDVRCEELTVELTHLLEERDTLQLKLSNTLRLNEELRMKCGNLESINIQNEQLGQDIIQSPSTSTAELNENEIAEKKNDVILENKISQLHNVNHLRDVRVKDERETRQKQMELLQRDIQHLPPEAVAQLREAHYTLSRDTQSASTVLLNWLWGKTTPKVLHM